MKKALSLILTMCLFLCLLCSCGTTDKKEENGNPTGDNNSEDDTSIVVDPAAKELLGGYHYVSTDKRGDETYTEEVITSVEWTENGAVMTGYEQDSDGDRSDMRMEITFDAEKRPATLVRTVTEGDEVEESRMRFEYPAERTVKMINSGFGDGESYCIYEYSEEGYLIREEYPTYVRLYEYDARGNRVLEKTDYNDETTEDRSTTITYTYDDDGKEISAVAVNSDGKEIQRQYFHYPNGNVMMELSVSDTGDANFNFRPYNPKDGLAWSYKMSASGGTECTAEKDAQGRIVKVTGVGFDGQTRTATFTYDAQGRLVKEVDFSGNVFTWEYDGQNRLVKYVRDYGTSKNEQTYTYDEKGRLIKEETISTRGNHYTTIREYNEAGMVVKMTESSYYPPEELYPEGYTSTNTVEITYVENAECHISDLWADLILKSFVGGI